MLTESPYYQQHETKLAPLMDYFEDTWVGHLHRSGDRSLPKYHIPWWNICESITSQEAITNTAVEGWPIPSKEHLEEATLHSTNASKFIKKKQMYQELIMEQFLTQLKPKISKQTKQIHELLAFKVDSILPTNGYHI